MLCRYRMKIIAENSEDIKDFNDVIKCILGGTAEKISTVLISFVLTGVCLIYWILASNFLFTTVIFLRGIAVCELFRYFLSCKRPTLR